MTPPRRALVRDPSFRLPDQAVVALFVTQLDDQSRQLERAIERLDAASMAWQPRPGRNSIGMLVAHIAMTEVFWIGVASGRTPGHATADASCRDVLGLGLDDDGMPLGPEGRHPASLAGWDLPRYQDLLAKARRHLRSEVAAWQDADLGATAAYEGREFTREWVLYHLLEHFAQHAGQVGLVRALASPP